MPKAVQIPEALDTLEFRDLWAEWIEAHGGQRYTARQRRMAIKRLSRWGHDAAIAALEHSLVGGYQGIFPDPTFKTKQPTATEKKLSTWEIKEKIKAIDNRLTDSDLAYEHVDPEKNRKRIATRRELIATRKELESQLLSG
ncbi:MAG: hypothetical protein AAGJ81_15995 [Verrucomicrobiota bacterium]